MRFVMLEHATLRDVFAGQAVAGLIASEFGWGPSYQGDPRQIALFAYEVADAMLVVRGEGTVAEVVGKLEGGAPDSARNIPWEKQLEADRDRYRAALVAAQTALLHPTDKTGDRVGIAMAVIDAALGEQP